MAAANTQSIAESSGFGRLAYESAVRALEHQERLVGELRGRTGLLLAAASLAVSFLAREAFAGHPRLAPAIVALCAFVVAVVASIYVLVPRADTFAFSLDARGLYEGLYSTRNDLAEVYRELVYVLGSSWSANERSLKHLVLALRIAAAGLTVEILVLTAMTADTLI